MKCGRGRNIKPTPPTMAVGRSKNPLFFAKNYNNLRKNNIRLSAFSQNILTQMAIQKKLINFKKRSEFDKQNAAGNILETSIVFIDDSKEIVTHNTTFDCSGGLKESEVREFLNDYYTKSEVDAAIEIIEGKLSGYYTKEEIDKKGYLTEHQSLDDYYTKSEVDAEISTTKGLVNNLGQTFGKNLSEAETRITNKIAYVKTANNSAQMEYCTANGDFSHAEGYKTTTTNIYEHASGKYNKSTKNSENFGDELNTLFSFGNGYNNSNPHNAFEIKQDGTIYVVDMSADGQYYEKPMIKLQDLISRMVQQAVGNIDLSNYYTKEETDNLLNPLDCGTY